MQNLKNYFERLKQNYIQYGVKKPVIVSKKIMNSPYDTVFYETGMGSVLFSSMDEYIKDLNMSDSDYRVEMIGEVTDAEKTFLINDIISTGNLLMKDYDRVMDELIHAVSDEVILERK